MKGSGVRKGTADNVVRGKRGNRVRDTWEGKRVCEVEKQREVRKTERKKGKENVIFKSNVQPWP